MGACKPGQALTGAALSIVSQVCLGPPAAPEAFLPQSSRFQPADSEQSARGWKVEDIRRRPSATPPRTLSSTSNDQNLVADPYSALARRYRPQTFDEVIGQEHIARALRNAIRNDRVAHGYIFTGARGVGKTSTARIFAKALNCPHAQDGVPCNECDICQAISIGADVDVTEMDGASNRGIDEIRQLRANVNIRPMRAHNKIYIIDEAHQLTKEAWNALLKTLEEPPPNVKFIFCTTEPEKLLDTVKSRCQRFDFSTVDTTNIIGRLSQIATAEGFAVEPAALELVARRAGGSMRDSQSLFDQLLAFGSDPITAGDVHQLLGTADEERLVAIVAGLAGADPASALRELDQTLSAGVRIQELFDQLVEYFRDLMVLASGANEIPLLSVSESQRATLASQAEDFRLNTILSATQILAEAAFRMRNASVARPLAELALARIALLNDLDDLATLIASLRSGTPPATTVGATRRGPRNIENVSQKKTLDSRSQPPQSLPTLAETTPFQPGNEDAILAQLVETSGGALKTHLMGLARLAIIGPDALEMTFPKRYSASQSYLEGVTGRKSLEEALAKITGQSIRIQLLTEPAEPSTEPESTADDPTGNSEEEPTAAARPNPPNSPRPMPKPRSAGTRRGEPVRLVTEENVTDPLVKLAMNIFETGEARVKILPNTKNDE